MDFKLNVDNLHLEQIVTLRMVLREGKEHLQYFEDTMYLFENPERRVKTHDTEYYEKVIPAIEKILRDYDHKNRI